MVIKRSTAREVEGLLRDLLTGDEAARETAAARLAVLGTRAVDGLVSVAVSDAPGAARSAALGALEAIGDPRAIDPAFGLLDHSDPSIALPAAGVLRRALDSPRGAEVLDRLAALAVDEGLTDRARLMALEALQGLPAGVFEPISERLARDLSPAVRAAIRAGGPSKEIDPRAALEAAAGEAVPEDPDTLRRWLAAEASGVPLPVLHRLVEKCREQEAKSRGAERRSAWMAVRGAIHLALAERGSRVALYDLRETVGQAADVPVEMLSALERIGDRSCLEPIAAAHARWSSPGTAEPAEWWRRHLAAAFRAIAAREKLTERLEEVRRIRTRWPETALDLIGLPKGRRAR